MSQPRLFGGAANRFRGIVDATTTPSFLTILIHVEAGSPSIASPQLIAASVE